MNHTQLKRITNKHYGELEKQIKKVAADFDVEDIHQFRVVYKRLRAFLRMLSNKVVNGGQIKISKKLKKAYHISGVIRDLQLQDQRIGEAADQGLDQPVAYLNLLHKEIEKLKTGFGEIISQKPVTKCKKKTDTAVPGKISELDFNLFIQKKWDTVNAIITTGNFGDKEIHAIRKHLKDLFYNLKIYETAERKILSPGIWNRKDEACFYQLLEELGTFQDNCTAITLVNTYLKKRKKVNDREQVTQIKKIWIKNKRNRKQVLVNKLRSARTF